MTKLECAHERIVLLLADDDEDDYLLTRDALRDCCKNNQAQLQWVGNGDEMLNYLFRRGKYSDPKLSPRPSIIIMDVNMPRKDGREALLELKSDPSRGHIPVICMSQAADEEEINFFYGAGATSFIKKPDGYTEVVNLMSTIHDYWFKNVLLPV